MFPRRDFQISGQASWAGSGRQEQASVDLSELPSFSQLAEQVWERKKRPKTHGILRGKIYLSLRIQDDPGMS